MGKQQIAERVKEAARILSWTACLSAARVSYLAVSVSVWRWRGIVREPAVFLFDEPLSNLDAVACRCVLNCNSRTVARKRFTSTLPTIKVEAMTLSPSE